MAPQQRSPQKKAPNAGQRGEAVKSGGNKIHGDDLEGIIPGKEPRTRPTRDDGDNDDKGELA